MYILIASVILKRNSQKNFSNAFAKYMCKEVSQPFLAVELTSSLGEAQISKWIAERNVSVECLITQTEIFPGSHSYHLSSSQQRIYQQCGKFRTEQSLGLLLPWKRA